ncbi:DMT family transporter [Rhizobium sp. KVB221]|uniref:DMT family transporter n=1 Tax=Rhizobium setariae TaxID=2801340 RepID=A0A937CMX0_9HYPH|nr:DMT family transporter [Rhizobium setariae]MBL0373176.1 DMT family transporter [Rhizobium setariae]
MSSRRDYQLGLLFVTISAIAWSTTGFFTRLIPLDSFTLLAWRGIFGSVSVLLVIILSNPKGWVREFTRIGRVELIYIALTVSGMMMFITSLRHTSVAHNAVIYATIPFLAGFLGWYFLREYPTRSSIVSSGVALVGVLLMVGFGGDGGLFGDILSFGMTLSMAASIIVIRKNPTMSVLPSACIGAIISVFICWPLGAPLDVTSLQLCHLALLGVVNSAIGLAFFALGSKKLPAVETALIGALDTPLAPLWVWIAFSETPGINTIIGGGIVLAAVIGHIIVSQKASPLPQAAG